MSLKSWTRMPYWKILSRNKTMAYALCEKRVEITKHFGSEERKRWPSKDKRLLRTKCIVTSATGLESQSLSMNATLLNQKTLVPNLRVRKLVSFLHANTVNLYDSSRNTGTNRRDCGMGHMEGFPIVGVSSLAAKGSWNIIIQSLSCLHFAATITQGN